MYDALINAATRLCRAAEARDWRGPDIYDALWWQRWPRLFTGGRLRRQSLIQLHARAPVDLRLLYRRSHPLLAKALAVFAVAELRLFAASADPNHATAAAHALHLLEEDRSAGDEAWGYPFDMQTRWSYYEAGTPNVVVTAFAIDALREGEQLPESARLALRRERAAEWVRRELFLEDLGCFAYHPDSRSVIHNANLLGATVVWEHHRDDSSARRAVERALERTLDAQRRDGSFPYGEGDGLAFVDSFHTGYVLACLGRLSEVHAAVEGALERGATYYRERFFDSDGRAVLWPDRAGPEDAHSAGTGLTSLSALASRGLADTELIGSVGARAIGHMLRGDHAIHRRTRLGATRVRYLRWCDSHMALGLVNGARAVGGVPSP
jgi:hypothetical protein